MNVSVQGVGRGFVQDQQYKRTYGENVSYCSYVFPHYSVFLLINGIHADITDRIHITLTRFNLSL